MNLNQKKIIDHYLGPFLFLILKPFVIFFGKIMKRNHDPEPQGDIVFVKLLGGGSLVIAFPSLLGVRKKYANQKMILVTTPAVKPFAQTLNIFDKIITVDESNFLKFVLDAFKAWIYCFRVDTVVDLEVHSHITTVFSIFTASRNRFGFFKENSFWRRGIFSHVIFYNPFSGSYSFYDAMAKALLATPASFVECRTHFLNYHQFKKKPDSAKKIICIGAVCSDNGKERMLTAENWLSVIQKNKIQQEQFLFLGGKADFEIVQKIINFLKYKVQSGELSAQLEFTNLCGTLPLSESIQMIYFSDEFWGVDSSLIHFARLLDVPSHSFWGPTAPETRLRPIENYKEKIHYNKIPCSPCIHFADLPPCKGRNLCISSLFDHEVKQIQSWIIPPTGTETNPL